MIGTLVFIGIVVAWNIGEAIWSHIRSRRPFDWRYAGVPLTIDPRSRRVLCHEKPTDEQLEAIHRWLAEVPWDKIRDLQDKRRLRPWLGR